MDLHNMNKVKYILFSFLYGQHVVSKLAYDWCLWSFTYNLLSLKVSYIVPVGVDHLLCTLLCRRCQDNILKSVLNVNEYTPFEKYNFKQYLNEHKNFFQNVDKTKFYITSV